jgi:hypothetical protein
VGKERGDDDHTARRLVAPLPPAPRDARRKPARHDATAAGKI